MDIFILVAALLALIWFVWWATRLKSWNARAICVFAALAIVGAFGAYVGTIFGGYFEVNALYAPHGPRDEFSRVFGVIREDMQRGDYLMAEKKLSLLADGWKEVSVLSRDSGSERSYLTLVRRIDAVKRPNQTPEPTPMAVTPPAAQEPRQP